MNMSDRATRGGRRQLRRQRSNGRPTGWGWWHHWLAAVRQALARVTTADRGDVPGWVLVTVMTAGLVTALWIVADDQLTSILTKAINSVTK